MYSTFRMYAFLTFFLAGVSHASLVTCDVNNATLDTVQLSNLDLSEPEPNGGPTGPNLLIGEYSASECIGLFEGNDSNNVNNNIGEFEDGLLNGDGGILTGNEFIDGYVDGNPSLWPDGELQDIDGDLNATDPGWINLARYDVDSNSTSYKSITSYDQSLTLAISDVLEFTFTCINDDGGECASINWTLTTDKDIVQTVQEVIGESTFDHLAFVTKAGNNWAIYDFNFYQIFGTELLAYGNNVFDFTTAYSLGGTLNVKPEGEVAGDFDASLSHLTVWARDPVDSSTTEVPEPSTIAIFGLSLIFLSFRKR